MDKFGAEEQTVIDDDASSMRSFNSFDSSVLGPGSEDDSLYGGDQESVHR